MCLITKFDIEMYNPLTLGFDNKDTTHNTHMYIYIMCVYVYICIYIHIVVTYK